MSFLRHLTGPLLALAAAAAMADAANATPTIGAGGGDCQLTVTPSSDTFSISGYDPFSTSPLSSTYAVLFQNTGSAACVFNVSFSTDAETYGLGGAGGQELPYTLFDTADNINVTPYSGVTPPADQPALNLAPGGQLMLHYAFIVDLTQLPTDGDFSQELLISAQTSAGQVLAEHAINLALNVAPSAVISLRGAYTSGPGGGAHIDLGALVPGPAVTMLQLFVQSTGGYRLDAESANNGVLRLNGAAQWSIPYTLSIGDHSMNLAQGGHFDAPRLANARQDLLPVGFVIGDTARKQAGRYEDIITLSVTAE